MIEKSPFRLVAASAFSALRRAVNRELDHLAQIIRSAPQLLQQDGSLVTITGTRVEDVVVMDGLQQLTQQGPETVQRSSQQELLNARALHSSLREEAAVLDWSTVPRILMPKLSIVDGEAIWDHRRTQRDPVEDHWIDDLLPKLQQEKKPSDPESHDFDATAGDGMLRPEEVLDLRPSAAGLPSKSSDPVAVSRDEILLS